MTTRGVILDRAAIATMLYGRSGYVNRAMRRFATEATKTTRRLADERVKRRTGTYRNSISARVVSEDRVEVAAEAPYSLIIEAGSRPHRIGSAVLVAGVGWRYIDVHPGTKAQNVLRDGVAQTIDHIAAIRYDG